MAIMPNHTNGNGRPGHPFRIIFGHRTLTPAYKEYLRNLIRINEDEKRELREIGVCPTEDSVERLEDFPGTAAFIERDRA
jgi:hypothetical protein